MEPQDKRYFSRLYSRTKRTIRLYQLILKKDEFNFVKALAFNLALLVGMVISLISIKNEWSQVALITCFVLFVFSVAITYHARWFQNFHKSELQNHIEFAQKLKERVKSSI